MGELKVLRFQLAGRTAFFKKPEVNTYGYFTYGMIHKVALLGIFGAILGYGGYTKQHRDKTDYPEFYEKLSGLKIAILPAENGCFAKKCKILIILLVMLLLNRGVISLSGNSGLKILSG